jgi:hypothetical protein
MDIMGKNERFVSLHSISNHVLFFISRWIHGGKFFFFLVGIYLVIFSQSNFVKYWLNDDFEVRKNSSQRRQNA